VRSAVLVAAAASALLAGCGGESGNSREADTTPTLKTVTEPDPPPVSVPGDERPNSARLSCTERRAANIDYLSDVGGSPDPLQAATQVLGKRLRNDDELENVGSSSRPVVTVARNGRTVAIVRFMKADSGWLANRIEACAAFFPG
jgi:hypothetical protein